MRALHFLAEGLSCEEHGHVGVRSVLVLVAGRATWSKRLICGLADVAMILLCLSVVLVLARVSARAAVVLPRDGRTVSLFVDLRARRAYAREGREPRG